MGHIPFDFGGPILVAFHDDSIGAGAEWHGRREVARYAGNHRFWPFNIGHDVLHRAATTG